MCTEMHVYHCVKWSLKLPDLNQNLNALKVHKMYQEKFHEKLLLCYMCTDRHSNFNRHSPGMQTGSADHWNEVCK